VFNNPPPLICGTTQLTRVGGLVTGPVQASDPVEDVELNVAGLPLGATMTPPLPTSGNPVSSVFAWTPLPGQEGTHVVTFTATDAGGLQSLCDLTIVVETGPTCNGLAATIHVKDGKIVGGPDDGKPYRGVLLGTSGNDVIVGTEASDLIKGFAGDDTICGGGGGDRIEGGAGGDWIDGGEGNDLIKGQEGNDTLFGGGGNDRIDGGPGDDFLDGGPGDNILDGQGGMNTCTSGPKFLKCQTIIP
jgi:hypothetical protein